jgi:uncharacterized membrane protein YgcG
MMLSLSIASSADERIGEFHSDIQIRVDGSMEILETIRVRAEGTEIRRGIYRDFPTDYQDRLGTRYRVGFDLVSVQRDGMSEPYRQERLSNGVRVYIGASDYFLPPNEYVYQLVYRTDHQLGFFPDHDELYWNVTGNGWGFPIDHAAARVSLPPAGYEISSLEGYVGQPGSTGQAYEASVESGGTATIRTTRALEPGEGLTLVATWPKGLVAEPSAASEMAYLIAHNRGLGVSLAGLLSALGYLLLVWHRAGRDPKRGVIFPHYEPPDRFSPASVRYVSAMSYDSKAFTAAIVNLAVKGYVRIDESGGEYTLERGIGGTAELAPGERALLDALFTEHDRVVLQNENHSIVKQAMRAHERSLDRDYNRIYFMTNSTLLMPGVAILLVTFGIVFLMGALTVLAGLGLGLIAVLIPVFYYLLKSPTRIGRRILDKIEGFKLYLEVAEKDELNMRNRPEKTPDLFEAYFPYALALGVEQPWAEKFTNVFDQLRSGTGQSYSPAWYGGRWHSADGSSDFGAFTSDLARSLGTAISSAATPPGSSSGSGGGGSSGGGGGGGGGGGW